MRQKSANWLQCSGAELGDFDDVSKGMLFDADTATLKFRAVHSCGIFSAKWDEKSERR
jgi:hypothetical protein